MGKAKNRKYKSKFLQEWLHVPKYKTWLKEVENDDSRAFCKLCQSSFDVGNMRLSSLDSHNEGTKHCRRLANAKSSPSIRSFFHKPAECTTTENVMDADSGPSHQV